MKGCPRQAQTCPWQWEMQEGFMEEIFNLQLKIFSPQKQSDGHTIAWHTWGNGASQMGLKK